jgi:hypothetical protein
MRVVKKCDDAQFQYDWLMAIPSWLRPSGLEIYNGALSYDFIDGQTPRDYYDVWLMMKQDVWGGMGLTVDRNQYCSYVAGLTDDNMSRVLRIIDKSELTSVTRCHGDLTLYNCIETVENDLVLFDPNDCHGLPCQELDESKLLQSLDGFDYVHKGLPPLTHTIMFDCRKVHWALLITHYIRMLRHPDKISNVSQSFARERIKSIMEWIT